MYLDTASTTPVRREVLEAMWPYLAGGEHGMFGNPSSRHLTGTRAAAALGEARERLAAALGCGPGEVIFTSGGTEAANLAVKGLALATPRGRRLVTTPIEHEAVLASADALRRLHGFEIAVADVGADGVVEAAALEAQLEGQLGARTALVSIQHASNEVGTVQPIAELAELARRAGAIVHTDAVQSAGWRSLRLAELGVDAVSIAGHKLGAPKGIGALVVRRGVPIEPVLHGGGQESGRRSGTENVAGAVGLAVALELAMAARRAAEVEAARDLLVAEVLGRVPGAFLTGAVPGEQRLPHHASFCFPGTNGETVLLELERDDVITSSGSACAAGSGEPSHVLLALGVSPDVAQTAVRLTLPETFSVDDAAVVATRIVDAVGRVARLRR